MSDIDVVGEELKRAGFPPEVYTEGPILHLVNALQALLRCPGIDESSPEQGATFRDIIEAALEQAGVKAEKKIDTFNHFGVSIRASTGGVWVMLPPKHDMPPELALNLAAHLAVLSFRPFEEFKALYDAIKNT